MAAKMKQTGTPWFVLLPYYALCAFLDVVYEGRPLARFWFLETVARYEPYLPPFLPPSLPLSLPLVFTIVSASLSPSF